MDHWRLSQKSKSQQASTAGFWARTKVAFVTKAKNEIKYLMFDDRVCEEATVPKDHSSAFGLSG